VKGGSVEADAWNYFVESARDANFLSPLRRKGSISIVQRSVTRALPLAHLRSRLFGNFLVSHRDHALLGKNAAGAKRTSAEDARQKW